MNPRFSIVCALGLLIACSKPEQEIQKQNIVAHPFELGEVTLLESPFKHALKKNSEWLTELKPDRFLYRYRKFAGLQPKDSIYGGWESRGVSGQSLGHYMTALSMMYAVTGEQKYLDRTNYIVKELAECQNAHGNGYVGAVPEHERIFSEISRGEINSAGFDLNGGWVPWYNLHKNFAGLIDIYRYTGNEQAKVVVTKLGDWAIETLSGLSEEQFQKMLDCEHGGMNEALAELYAITGDKRYYELAEKFNHHEILDPLMQQKDQLAGLHANTQIPKVIGLGRQYEYNGGEKKRLAAEFFWDRVVNHHSYVIGGNSDFEHFGPADSLNGRLSKNTAETCNTYNMLKLTKELFSWDPDVKYADYYERALYNHILASQNPETGMVCYYMNMKAGEKKVYSTPFDSFWCCVGTGMENHTKYGEFIYFHSENTLWVNLFIPSQLTWVEEGAKVTLETDYPRSEKVKLKVELTSPQDFEMKLRLPTWTAAHGEYFVNGETLDVNNSPGSYVSINREWHNGDVVVFGLPMSLHTVYLPGDPHKLSLQYGPTVLAADLGKDEVAPMDIPTLVMNEETDPENYLEISGHGHEFKLEDIAKPNDITLRPFNEIVDDNYTVYFDVLDQEGWQNRLAHLKEEMRIEQEVIRRTLDIVRIGEMQPERDHEFKGEKTDAGGSTDKWRHATDGGWFSYEMDLKGKSEKVVLRCKYFGPDAGNRNFDILVDGVKIATQSLKGDIGNEFFYINYPIPDELLKGKEKITVRFQAHPGATAGGVFGCRLIDVSGNVGFEI